jgi:hypothetical protein
MANPVIVDCGGSTRIKRLENGGMGAMNSLLDVDPALTPPSSTQRLNNTYAHVTIASVNADGKAMQQLDSAVAGNDKFTITSENGQSVVLQINANNTMLTMTVQGLPNNPPLVEAKHFNKKRRYVAINAGAITSIVGTANGRPVNFDAVAANSIYVTLVLNE